MQDKNMSRLDTALYALPYKIAALLSGLPSGIKKDISEIRLRADKPLGVTLSGAVGFINDIGQVESALPKRPVIVTSRDINDTVRLLCNNSVYSHEDEIKNGYITMRYGHRAGVTGNFSGDKVYDFSSVNIRIAREILGSADFLVDDYTRGGVLIAGPPASGKTTILRDFIRQLSSGATGRFYRIAAVDTRGELSASVGGISGNDLGINTDVLLGAEKPRGIEIALRTFSPDIIAFDEIVTDNELKLVSQCFGAGVDIAVTAHIKGFSELSRREVTRKLILSGAVKMIAVLPRNYTEKPEIYTLKEIKKCLF